jgi:hypothetical protein
LAKKKAEQEAKVRAIAEERAKQVQEAKIKAGNKTADQLEAVSKAKAESQKTTPVIKPSPKVKPATPQVKKAEASGVLDAVTKSITDAYTSVSNKVTEVKSAVTDATNQAVNVASGLMSDDENVSKNSKDYVRNKLLKDGVIEETTVVEKKQVDNSKVKGDKIPFQKLATVSSKENPNDKYMSYRRQATNEEGIVYVPIPRKEKWAGFKKNKTLDKIGYETGAGGEHVTKGVEGIAHFLIDNDISGDKKAQFKETKNSVERLKRDKTKWLPVYKKNEDGTVTVKYTQGMDEFKNLAKEGYDDFSNLRQLKVSDINWNSERRPKGFGEYVRNLTDKNGNDTYLLFRPTGNKKYKGKDAMGKFEGNSVVMLFKDNNGNSMIREYAGSLNGIIEELNSIKSKYKVSDKDITLGFYDAGSYSAKPEAKNGVLKSSSYGGFNDQAVSGAALAIPIGK